MSGKEYPKTKVVIVQPFLPRYEIPLMEAIARLPGVDLPVAPKPMVEMEKVRMMDPVVVKGRIGDGNYGGLYQRADEEMLALWQVAVEETRALLAGSWGGAS